MKLNAIKHTLLIPLLSFTFVHQEAKAQTWSNASVTSPANTALNGVSFVSPTFSFAGGTYGNNGVLRKSFNAGQDWNQFSTTSSEPENDVYFFSNTTGIVLTASGYVYRTTDGGATFNLQLPGQGFNGALKKIAFASPTVGYVAGGNFASIYKTTDAGISWTQQFPANFMIEWRSVHAPTTSNAWVVGQDGLINVTTDGGSNWTPQTSGVTSMLQDVHFQNATTGFIVGNNGVILKTTNGGATWGTLTSGTTVNLNAIDFVSATEGWIVGNGGTVLHTIDGGSTWSPFTSGTTENLLDVDFLNVNLGLATGTNGKIIRYQGNCTETNSASYTHCGTYFWGGQPRTTSGTYVSTFINLSGCDSTVTLDLTILPISPASNLTINTCDSYTLNGITYTTGGSYTQTIPSFNGCDSSINLTLNLGYSPNPTVFAAGNILNAQTTSGGSIQWVDCNNGNAPIPGETNLQFIPTLSGSYAVIETSFSCGTGTSPCIQFCVGLNSSVSISGNTLSALQNGASYQWIDCDNGNAPISGATSQTFTPTTSGNYAVEITFNGCTGLSNCNTVCLINSSVTVNGNTLTATQVGANYQWLDCDDFNEPISGATAQSFTPTVSGNYAVFISYGACNLSSACTAITIGTSGIEEQTTAAFVMFPNPANEFVTINNLTIGSALQMVDMTGKVVFTSNVSTSEMNLDLNSINNGIYFVQTVNNSEITCSKKLVVNK